MSALADWIRSWFRSSAPAPETESELARAQRVHDNALLFLRAGGTLSLREWLDLDPVEQAAFVLAGDRHAERRAAELARLLGSPAAAAEVLTGGAARREEALRLVSVEVLEELRGARPPAPAEDDAGELVWEGALS